MKPVGGAKIPWSAKRFLQKQASSTDERQTRNIFKKIYGTD